MPTDTYAPLMHEINPRVRAQRLSAGKCPMHGRTLVRKGALTEDGLETGSEYKCPETGCDFDVAARSGTRLDKLLRR